MKLLRNAVLALSLSPLPALAMPAGDHLFKVYLDDREIGTHSFEFEPQAGGYRVESRAEYSVKVLFINLYNYRHRATELWSDGCLAGIESTTDDNGENFRVSGEAEESGMTIAVNGETRQVEKACIRTFAYWDPGLLRSGDLLNSQTGELSPVALEDLGETPLPWDEESRGSAYLLETEEGDIHLWYDDRRWLGLKTVVGEDRVLTYRPVTAPESGRETP